MKGGESGLVRLYIIADSCGVRNFLSCVLDAK